jgi:transposase InsO family protein
MGAPLPRRRGPSTAGSLLGTRTPPHPDATAPHLTDEGTPISTAAVTRHLQILAHELLYARGWESEPQRSQAIRTWLIHYNYHRPHTAVDDQSPASRAPKRVTNVMRNNN